MIGARYIALVIIPKCNDTKHGVGVGNSNKWFNSYNEAVSYYDNLIYFYRASKILFVLFKKNTWQVFFLLI